VYEGPIQDLIDELSRLPGIGPKSAQRLAFHLVKAPPDDAKRLAESIVQAKERIFFCKECGNVAEGDLCRICRDEGRDRTVPLRRRGAQGRLDGREGGRDQGPVPRARRRDQARSTASAPRISACRSCSTGCSATA
jgi:hypothetical protein